MSVEAPARSTEARVKELHGKVDAKAHILSDLWKTANNMPEPLLFDPPELISSENFRLRTVMQRAEVLMPDDHSAYLEADYLSEKISTVSPQERFELEAKLKNLRDKNPDIDFIRFINEGVEGLIRRRASIRAFQAKYGMPEAGRYYVGELKRFGDIEELPKGLGGAITRVYVGNYSISIFIDEEAYNSKEEFNKEFPTNGLHFNESIINVIKDPVPFLSRRQLSSSQIHEEPKLMSIVRHEELHAMEDAFFHDNPDFRNEKNRVGADLYRAVRDINVENYSGLITVQSHGELDLTKIPDASLEELIAEFASTSDRDQIPSSTYAIYTDQKIHLIKSIVENPDIKRRDIKVLTKRMLSNKELREEIEDLYFMVDYYIPERSGEVDALFTIFPPSTSFRHIRSTVERWIRERDG
jgi:hypothetical protein